MAKRRRAEEDDKSFQDRLLSMLEWLADKDPVRAAKLIGEYLDDLAGEMSPKTPRGSKA